MIVSGVQQKEWVDGDGCKIEMVSLSNLTGCLVTGNNPRICVNVTKPQITIDLQFPEIEQTNKVAIENASQLFRFNDAMKIAAKKLGWE